MGELKIIPFRSASGFGLWYAAFGWIRAQTEVPADGKSSITRLRNNAPTISDDAFSSHCHEDIFCGIEKFKKKISAEGK